MSCLEGEMKEVEILGATYTVETDVERSSDIRLGDGDAFCDYSTKTIKLAKIQPDNMNQEDLSVYKQRVMRHEIIHAFLFESGLDNETWARDESIIDWMALQFHKIGKVIAQCVD